YEHLLLFDVLLGGCIEHRNGDKTTVCAAGDGGISSAVASRHVMSCGAHFAEFQITGTPMIGIVRPMPSLDTSAYQNGECSFSRSRFYPDFLAQRLVEWGDDKVHACEYDCEDGLMNWTNWDDGRIAIMVIHYWEGMEDCRTGDTVGMLLNLDEGTLSVYKNNRRLGVMKDGLSGPYCCCDFGDTVGMLLNLDDGTLSVYKNNRRLGVIKDGLRSRAAGTS
ncbi:hypothetical protein THAOC_36911, partial [Thalassiosira oceanica]